MVSPTAMFDNSQRRGPVHGQTMGQTVMGRNHNPLSGPSAPKSYTMSRTLGSFGSGQTTGRWGRAARKTNWASTMTTGNYSNQNGNSATSAGPNKTDQRKPRARGWRSFPKEERDRLLYSSQQIQEKYGDSESGENSSNANANHDENMLPTSPRKESPNGEQNSDAMNQLNSNAINPPTSPHSNTITSPTSRNKSPWKAKRTPKKTDAQLWDLTPSPEKRPAGLHPKYVC
jgi:hypothetical protein